METKSKNLNDSVIWLYAANDVQSVLTTANSLLSGSKFTLSTLILSSKDDILELIENRQIKNFEYALEKKDGDLYKFELNKTDGEEISLNGRFLLFKHSRPFTYVIITHENPKFIKNGIIRFFNGFYPKITMPFLSSVYMRDVLKNLENKVDDMTIRSARVVSKSRITSSGAKKKIESDVKWTDEHYAETFDEAIENDKWVNSINFELTPLDDENTIINLNSYKIKCQLSRNGLFKCNRDYLLFYKTVIDNISKKASEDLQFFDNRGRSEHENLEPKPIVIDYDFEVFKDKNQNRRLINVLQKMTYSSLSVYHANPYLHASFVDYRDGSSYDIWVLNNNRITIVPQMRSTFASIERLCELIFTGFREGKIKNLSEVNDDC